MLSASGSIKSRISSFTDTTGFISPHSFWDGAAVDDADPDAGAGGDDDDEEHDIVNVTDATTSANRGAAILEWRGYFISFLISRKMSCDSRNDTSNLPCHSCMKAEAPA
jgi:hypothetical protein